MNADETARSFVPDLQCRRQRGLYLRSSAFICGQCRLPASLEESHGVCPQSGMAKIALTVHLSAEPVRPRPTPKLMPIDLNAVSTTAYTVLAWRASGRMFESFPISE